MRHAFSLVEILIAIGILGIGLIIVGSTFIVGIDQSRIVADETKAGLVLRDARVRLPFLVNEPKSVMRVWDGTAWHELRECIKDSPLGEIRDRLPVPGGTVDLNDLLIAPYRVHTVADKDGFYPLAVAVPGQPLPPHNEYRGAETRIYPAIQGRLTSPTPPWHWRLPLREGPPIEPQYNWQALYRKLRPGTVARVQEGKGGVVLGHPASAIEPRDWSR